VQGIDASPLRGGLPGNQGSNAVLLPLPVAQRGTSCALAVSLMHLLQSTAQLAQLLTSFPKPHVLTWYVTILDMLQPAGLLFVNMRQLYSPQSFGHVLCTAPYTLSLGPKINYIVFLGECVLALLFWVAHCQVWCYAACRSSSTCRAHTYTYYVLVARVRMLHFELPCIPATYVSGIMVRS
jgi:hypothetical protein